MALEWTHESCGSPECDGTTDCEAFPTVTDRINIARAAYEEYAETDDTSVIDFALDALLLAQSEHPKDKALFTRLARQARKELRAYARKRRRFKKCTICGDGVPESDFRDHLAGHSTAAESAIDDPSEFFEDIDA